MSIQPTHEPTRLTFKLAEEYTRLRAVVGVWDDHLELTRAPGGVVEFRVLADGALVHHARFAGWTRDGSALAIDVRTVNELVIEVHRLEASPDPGSFWLADVRFDPVETGPRDKSY